jgi:hypothetical protein
VIEAPGDTEGVEAVFAGNEAELGIAVHTGI